MDYLKLTKAARWPGTIELQLPQPPLRPRPKPLPALPRSNSTLNLLTLHPVDSNDIHVLHARLRHIEADFERTCEQMDALSNYSSTLSSEMIRLGERIDMLAREVEEGNSSTDDSPEGGVSLNGSEDAITRLRDMSDLRLSSRRRSSGIHSPSPRRTNDLSAHHGGMGVICVRVGGSNTPHRGRSIDIIRRQGRRDLSTLGGRAGPLRVTNADVATDEDADDEEDKTDTDSESDSDAGVVVKPTRKRISPPEPSVQNSTTMTKDTDTSKPSTTQSVHSRYRKQPKHLSALPSSNNISNLASLTGAESVVPAATNPAFLQTQLQHQAETEGSEHTDEHIDAQSNSSTVDKTCEQVSLAASPNDIDEESYAVHQALGDCTTLSAYYAALAEYPLPSSSSRQSNDSAVVRGRGISTSERRTSQSQQRRDSSNLLVSSSGPTGVADENEAGLVTKPARKRVVMPRRVHEPGESNYDVPFSGVEEETVAREARRERIMDEEDWRRNSSPDRALRGGRGGGRGRGGKGGRGGRGGTSN
ncbi:hypothetical protein LTR17_026717 [Elasticomyces elasticus]|nr:hypothetical protein LTR17_026717 [Elasticomyces elasticus]